MNKRILFYLLAALALAGCATTTDPYIEAQKAALVREGDARVAEAQAIAAIAGKLDAGGAAAYAVMVAMRGAQAGHQSVRVERPRDWMDALQAVSGFIGAVGNVAVPIVSIRSSRDTAIAGYNRDIRLEEARQSGESARIQSIGAIATSVATAPRPPTTSITVTAGGDAVVQGGSIDRRNCPVTAGPGAPGGTSVPTTGGIGAPGGPGGNASGGC